MLANPALLVDSLRQRVGGEPSHKSCLRETWRYQGGAMPTAVRRSKLVHVNNLDFAVFLNGASVPIYTQTLGAPGSPVPFQFPELTSISSVIVGVTFGAKNPGGCCEGYTVALAQARPGTAPEPATIALVAA